VVAEAAAGGHHSVILFRLRDTHGLDGYPAPTITSGYGAPLTRATVGIAKAVIQFVRMKELEKDVTKSEALTFLPDYSLSSRQPNIAIKEPTPVSTCLK
jgi:hypothetical protein